MLPNKFTFAVAVQAPAATSVCCLKDKVLTARDRLSWIDCDIWGPDACLAAAAVTSALFLSVTLMHFTSESDPTFELAHI